jgi:iron complex transport system substrate-binding protein
VITTTGEVLGKKAEAETVISDIDAAVAEAGEAHPEFQGKTIAAVKEFQAFYVYTPADPRVEFLEDLGFEIAPSVEELDTGESTFFYTLSYEETDKLTSDVLVSYSDDQKQADAFAKADTTKVMDQAKAGAIAPIVGTQLVAAVSPPTALSLTWGLDEFVSVLSKAATAAG